MQIKSNKQRRYSAAIASAVLAGCALTIGVSPTYAANTPTVIHEASGFGVEVKVGGVAKVGPIALAEVPQCSPKAASMTASAASVNEAGLVVTGAVSSSAVSTLTSSVGESDIYGLNILGGVITADEIKAVSTSSMVDGVAVFSSDGSIFSGLKVLGAPVSVNIAPNTVIQLPLIGSVTLNEQVSAMVTNKASLTVNMVHVRITLGARKGTEIIISQGLSYIRTTSDPAVVGGYAYAPQLVAGGISSGPLVLEQIPCLGTGGVVESDSIASTSLPGLLSTGTVTVTGEGNLTKSQSMSQATSSIADINLLSGLLSATAINGVATGTTTNGTAFNFTGGSTFVGLVVSGYPELSANVPPNTKVKIANLGTLYLNHIEYFSDKIRVAPIELEVNTTNALGLPIGADLTVGVVEAALHSAAIP